MFSYFDVVIKKSNSEQLMFFSDTVILSSDILHRFYYSEINVNVLRNDYYFRSKWIALGHKVNVK